MIKEGKASKHKKPEHNQEEETERKGGDNPSKQTRKRGRRERCPKPKKAKLEKDGEREKTTQRTQSLKYLVCEWEQEENHTKQGKNTRMVGLRRRNPEEEELVKTHKQKRQGEQKLKR